MVHRSWLYLETHDLLNFLANFVILDFHVKVIIQIVLFCLSVIESHWDAIHIAELKLTSLLISQANSRR